MNATFRDKMLKGERDAMKYDLPGFGVFLRASRKHRHLTQQQLASAVGVYRSAIIRWEQGDFLPPSKAIVLELAPGTVSALPRSVYCAVESAWLPR